MQIFHCADKQILVVSGTIAHNGRQICFRNDQKDNGHAYEKLLSESTFCFRPSLLAAVRLQRIQANFCNG